VAAAALLVLAGITRTYSAATAPSVRVPAVLEYGNLRAYYEKVAAAPTPEETISAVDYFVTLQWRETPEYPWADDTEAALDLWIKACSVPSVDRDVQRGMLMIDTALVQSWGCSAEGYPLSCYPSYDGSGTRHHPAWKFYAMLKALAQEPIDGGETIQHFLDFSFLETVPMPKLPPPSTDVKQLYGTYELTEMVMPDHASSVFFGTMLHVPPPIPPILKLVPPMISGKILYYEGHMITSHAIGSLFMRYAGPWYLDGTMRGGTIRHYAHAQLKDSRTVDTSPIHGVRYRTINTTDGGRSISLYVVGQATLTWKKTTKDAKMI